MQKTISIAMSIVLSLVIAVSSISILKVGKSVTTDLSMSGTTATCFVNVRSEKSTDNIEISVKLYCGDEVVAEWNGVSSEGTLYFSRTATVKKGKTYVMKTSCSINGKSYSK